MSKRLLRGFLRLRAFAVAVKKKLTAKTRRREESPKDPPPLAVMAYTVGTYRFEIQAGRRFLDGIRDEVRDEVV
jgi:hypothetical protein